MTTLEELARQIQQAHGIDSYGAALEIVGVYIDQIAADAALYDPDARELTDQGSEVVAAAVAASIEHGMYGTVAQQLLDAISNAAKSITEKTAERDSLIRAAMKTELPRAAIAEAADLTEARLYQIRDGRR